MRKVFEKGVLTQRQWAITSLILFFVSLIIGMLALYGPNAFCKLSPNLSAGYLECQNVSFYRALIYTSFLVLVTASLFGSVFAFYRDDNRRHFFWKVIKFLVPILSLIVFVGFNISFCLMFSCSHFGGQAIILAVFCFTAFVFGMGWPMVIKNSLRKEYIHLWLWPVIIILPVVYVGVSKMVDYVKNHESKIQYYKFVFNQNESTLDSMKKKCDKAFFSSTRDSCLLNTATRLNIQGLCNTSSSEEVVSYCVASTQCGELYPGYENRQALYQCKLEKMELFGSKLIKPLVHVEKPDISSWSTYEDERGFYFKYPDYAKISNNENKILIDFKEHFGISPDTYSDGLYTYESVPDVTIEIEAKKIDLALPFESLRYDVKEQELTEHDIRFYMDKEFKIQRMVTCQIATIGKAQACLFSRDYYGYKVSSFTKKEYYFIMSNYIFHISIYVPETDISQRSDLERQYYKYLKNFASISDEILQSFEFNVTTE